MMSERYRKMAEFELKVGSHPRSRVVKYCESMARYWERLGL